MYERHVCGVFVLKPRISGGKGLTLGQYFYIGKDVGQQHILCFVKKNPRFGGGKAA